MVADPVAGPVAGGLAVAVAEASGVAARGIRTLRRGKKEERNAESSSCGPAQTASPN